MTRLCCSCRLNPAKLSSSVCAQCQAKVDKAVKALAAVKGFKIIYQ